MIHIELGGMPQETMALHELQVLQILWEAQAHGDVPRQNGESQPAVPEQRAMKLRPPHLLDLCTLTAGKQKGEAPAPSSHPEPLRSGRRPPYHRSSPPHTASAAHKAGSHKPGR